MEVIIHREIEFLEKKIPTWEILKEKFHEITIFQDINWIKSWWEVKSKHMKMTPYILEIIESNTTIGIIPLYCSFKKIAGVNFRILKPIGIEESDYLLPILSKEFPPNKLLGLAIKKLYEDKLNWDFIEWADIPENSFFDAFLKNNLLGKDSYILRQRTHKCPLLTLYSDVEDVKVKIDEELLKKILSKERKLNKKGTLTFSKVMEEQEIEPIMNKFFELHCDRWGKTDTPSKFTQLEEREHAILAAKYLFKSNLLNLVYLKYNNEIISIEFGMSDGKRIYLYIPAFNIKFRNYCVGHLLNYYMILDACKEGYDAVDFLRGNEKHKQQWGTLDKFNVRYVLFNHSIRSILFKLIYHTYNSQHLKLYNLRFIRKRLYAMASKNEK